MAEKVTLVVIKNPFEPWYGREIIKLEPGQTALEIMKEHSPAPADMVMTFNGLNVVEETKTKEGDMVVIYPRVAKGGGGKQILAIVASIALTIAAGAAGAAFAAESGAWTVASYVASAAVMFIGSTLINRFLAPKVDTGKYNTNTNSNPTYSWDGIQTMEGQNNAVAITYGTVESGGQSIGKYTEASGDNEYLNWLVAAGEGPLEITDVMINDNPVSYYRGMSLEIRNGTNTQAIVPYFNSTYFSKNLGYQLTETARVDTAQGNATEGLIVKVEFPQGLYYADDSGGLSTAWVSVAAYYRLQGTESWTQFASATIYGSSSSALRREYRVDNLTPGTYEVQMVVTGRSHGVTNSRAAVRCNWSMLTSVVYDDFCYPNIALLGIKALATDQISGTPNLRFKKTRANVWVWNPHTEQYEQKPANNPAWASYDMLHQCQYLEHPVTHEWSYDVRGVPAKYLIYDQFNEWATFCTTKELYINIEIAQLGEMLDVINKNIANIGRGKVLRLGTKYGAVWDCVKQPVQMFGMGNIISGTFQEEFMETNDRANAVEVTYMDAANNFNRETITIYSDDYDNATVEKTAEATYDGITSYEQAYREGVYQLKCNQYLLRTCSFEANIDAIACTIGDLVMVAHDVPMWARSGRIYSVKGDVLKLPVQLEDTINTYRIMYRTVNDNLYTTGVEILSNADGWCEVRLAEMNDEDMPQKDDIFDLAIASVGSKPFIVKNITRAQDFTRKIECIEYNENVYNEDYDIPEPQYTDESKGIQNATNLDGTRYEFLGADGTLKYRMDVSWERASTGDFYIFTSSNGVDYNQIAAGITDTSYSADVDENTRWVKVVTGNAAMRTDGTAIRLSTISLIASLDITGLDVDVNGRSVYASWDRVSASNLECYQVALNDDVQTTDNRYYQFSNLQPGLYSLTVSALTKAGSEGPPVTHAIEIS
ncbi:MAG: hypothetical protein J6N55_12520 [Anaerovibrio sp.]|uniref:host specificity factor TipJ family phage tail protein n=1 Tax=Anaerovibrio sp. TaxID=1872532 RepID=UPI001B1A046C|nr:host specificity factor TipJ family phage tail protein [Anaerovibrio sp.]MBO6247087.1 hypothetical protein [Anaerovibrio sp.]